MRHKHSVLLEPRGRFYRYHWEIRSHLSSFGLLNAIRLLEESQWWPPARLNALRDSKLRRLVAHAYAQIPYYRHMMDESGVRPSDIQGVADLHRLPILAKDTLRNHYDELRARDIPDRKTELGVTGGTTGNPMRVRRDKAGTVWQRASYWRGYSWGGLHPGDAWVQVFGGALGLAQPTLLNKLKNWFAGKLFLPAFELGAHNVDAYIEAIRRSGARFLVGYTSACHLFAQHVERTGQDLKFEAVFPTAELLHEQWAETIGRVFGAKVLPYYGCGEVQSLGYSCPVAPRPLYHTCDEHVIIEIEGEPGQTHLAGEGPFLVTDLDNLAMPLIRYRNGDAGVLAEPGCDCGRSLRRIQRLDGRVNDVLITTRGDAISGAIGAHSFRLVQQVDQFQIVQRRPGQITIKVVAGAEYDPRVAEPTLDRIFRNHLGADAVVEFEYVTSIPRTVAGKARVVVNQYLEEQAKPQPPNS
ncbi:MAG: phenylacetate--CoA ligase family protein [Polyangiaceae bacterium]|nr:phenylacetate--CoA ligase family protein [Polyangiaceae bacterium]